jgi:hypothetical protein
LLEKEEIAINTFYPRPQALSLVHRPKCINNDAFPFTFKAPTFTMQHKGEDYKFCDLMLAIFKSKIFIFNMQGKFTVSLASKSILFPMGWDILLFCKVEIPLIFQFLQIGWVKFHL